MELLKEHELLGPRNLSQYLLLITSLTLILWIIKWLWIRRKLYYYSMNIPGPLAFPIIGNIYLFLGNNSDIMKTILNVQKKYPKLARIWFGTALFYLVSEPQHIEKVLNSPKCLNKNEHYRYLSAVVGTGLITAPAEKWRKHRKVIMPSFNQRILNSFCEIFSEQANILTQQLNNYVGQKDIDLYLLLSRCTLDIICETAMGVQMHTQTSDSDFGRNLDKLMEIITLRICHPWYSLDFLFNISSLNKEYSACVKKFRDFTTIVVKKKMTEYKETIESRNSSTIVGVDDESPRKIQAFLDLILNNSNFTEEELREEVDIFVIAGSDTTASALSCIFTMLAMFHDVQEKVYEEILEVLGPDRTVLHSDLSNFKYMERVIKESLRLFPVAAFFLRKVKEDLDLGDLTIPQGSSVFFGNVHIHRNPNYWPDPLKFDPDRFLPENVVKRHPCTYIPFSYGPRNCIGARYGMMTMKIIVSTVLRKYKFFTEYKCIKDIKLKTNILLRLKDGTKLQLERR